VASLSQFFSAQKKDACRGGEGYYMKMFFFFFLRFFAVAKQSVGIVNRKFSLKSEDEKQERHKDNHKMIV
jgi:hypothetical protein